MTTGYPNRPPISPGSQVKENLGNDVDTKLQFCTMPPSDIHLSQDIYEIPPLKNDGSNYYSWKSRQIAVLRSRGLLSIVDGSEELPALPNDDESKDPETVAIRVAAIESWKTRDLDAFAQITLNTDDKAIECLVETTSARQAWIKIAEVWESEAAQSFTALYQQLMSTRIEHNDVTNGFNNLYSIASKLKILGEPISDQILAQIMITALPACFAGLKAILRTPGQVCTVTPDAVLLAALTEEARHKKCLGLGSTLLPICKPEAQTIMKDLEGKKNEGLGRQVSWKSGQTKRQYWENRRGTEGTFPSKHPDDTPILYHIPLIIDAPTQKSWILSSIASRHMTPNRQWFTVYQTLIPPIHVEVDNGNRIPAIGVGRIFLTLRDPSGNESQAVIDDALHVPDLCASLLSVRKLVGKGINVLFDSSGAALIANQGLGPTIGFARGSTDGLYELDSLVTDPEETA